MSQTQTDPSQTQSQTTSPGAPPAADDPLAHLHKMSTTAGLGSADYVAVSGTAVFAMLAGLASGLALMSEVLLILPLVAIVAAVMAWNQIRHSNGTQTGRGLVALALVLSLGFGGFVFARWATEGYRTSEDRKAIGQLIETFTNKVKADDVAGAYDLFGERFQSQIDAKTFTDRLKLLQGYYGKLTKVEWNGLVEFQDDTATGNRFGVTTVGVQFEKAPAPVKDTAMVHKTSSGTWQFERMSEIFPPPAPPGQQQRKGGGQ